MDSVAKAMVEHMTFGVIILDTQLRIQYWNRLISDCCGKALRSVQGLPLVAVFPETATDTWRHMLEHAHGGGHPVCGAGDLETPFPTISCAGKTAVTLRARRCFSFQCERNDTHFGLLFSGEDAPWLGSPADSAAVSASAQEILVRELERANSQLLQSEKLAAIGQLAAGVAHEINNPIGYVSSNLKTLSEYVKDVLLVLDSVDANTTADSILRFKETIEYQHIRGDVAALLEESEEGIQRVKRIITALKDFSHIDEEEFRLADLHRGLDTTLNVVNNELKYKAEIVKLYGELPEVECIASQINQVIMNLLVNAAQAIEHFGRITLRTGAEEGWVWLDIEDTGKGIEKHILNRIYEPFFTTKAVGKGTGLGLSLSYNIIDKHHGRIDVFSVPDEGTRFRVWLPLRQPVTSSDT